MKTSLTALCICCCICTFAQSTYDLRYPTNQWRDASVPSGAQDPLGNILFPEAALVDSTAVNFNKAKVAWYDIDPIFQEDRTLTPAHIAADDSQQQNHYVRTIYDVELTGIPSAPFSPMRMTMDVAFYPQERGPYNYETTPTPFSQGIDPNTGELLEPESRWGGIMRALDNTDFEAEGISHLTFMVLDPFIYDSNSSGGSLYINFGDISEDYMKDSRKFAEASLTCTSPLDTTAWGLVPVVTPTQNTFSTDSAERACQDVGFDGLNDDDERTHFSAYLSRLSGMGASNAVYAAATDDPSGDNYHYYLGNDYDAQTTSVLERYKRLRNAQVNNSPETEDINGDWTVNESESYFQYHINLTPNMQVGQNFITDKRTVQATNQNQSEPPATWYTFRIPLTEFDSLPQMPPDFKSIRWMRMFLTNFEDSVILRFVELDLEKTTTSTAELPVTENQFRVYPNPTEGKFVIDGSTEIDAVTIYDMLGKVVTPKSIQMQAHAKQMHVDLGMQGVFFVRIQSGKEVRSYKVISR